MSLCVAADVWSQQQKLRGLGRGGRRLFRLLGGDQRGDGRGRRAGLMIRRSGPNKARPMSLCAAVESGASSRSWRPRTRRQGRVRLCRWRSAGRRSWSARRVMMAQRVVQGSAYVFVRSGGVWSQQQKLLASDAAAGDEFGLSVAISGETVVVGAASTQSRLGLRVCA